MVGAAGSARGEDRVEGRTSDGRRPRVSLAVGRRRGQSEAAGRRETGSPLGPRALGIPGWPRWRAPAATRRDRWGRSFEPGDGGAAPMRRAKPIPGAERSQSPRAERSQSPRADRSQSPAPTEANPRRRAKPIPVTGPASGVPGLGPKSRDINAVRDGNPGAPTEANSCHRSVVGHRRSPGLTTPRATRDPAPSGPNPRRRANPTAASGSPPRGPGGRPGLGGLMIVLSKSNQYHPNFGPVRSPNPRRRLAAVRAPRARWMTGNSWRPRGGCPKLRDREGHLGKRRDRRG